MKENSIAGNNSLPESAHVSIVDWLRKSDDLTHQLFEPESLALYIASILGSDSTDQFGIPTSPPDELARFLLELQDAVSSDDTKRRQAIEMIERAVELCFINAPAYRAALHLYRMELAGELYVGGWRAGALSTADSLVGGTEDSNRTKRGTRHERCRRQGKPRDCERPLTQEASEDSADTRQPMA